MTEENAKKGENDTGESVVWERPRLWVLDSSEAKSGTHGRSTEGDGAMGCS